MLRAKEFPKGAIASVDEFLALSIGQTIHAVAVPFSSQPHCYCMVKKSNIVDQGRWLQVEGWLYTADSPASALDYNLILNGYNDNFLFKEKKDAEAFVAECQASDQVYPYPGNRLIEEID